MNFNKMHHYDTPLLICNVWDVQSTRAATELNYKAIGTSSGAIATMLGYEDGENMSFEELKYMVKKIIKNVDLPLTVDLEGGYSRNPNTIVYHIEQLYHLGVVGVNIEDSVIIEGKRTLLGADLFSNVISSITSELARRQIDMFINIRNDTFLLGLEQALQQTIDRANVYKQAGANGLFIPCIEKADDIQAIVKSCSLPINVMCMPNLPSFEFLSDIGVSRISMGNFVYEKLTTHLSKELKTIQVNNSFRSIFNT